MYEKFAQLLQERGITSYRVSKDTGISQSTLSDWKNGKSAPKLDKLQRIADYFGVSVSYFYDEEKTPKNKNTPAPEAEDERVIEKILAETRRKLENQEGLMFDGGIASPEAIDSIIAAMEIGLNIAKKRTAEEKERARQLKEEIIREAERLEEEDRKHGK